eukprot:680046-Prorocentrum_minimum.AAC.1
MNNIWSITLPRTPDAAHSIIPGRSRRKHFYLLDGMTSVMTPEELVSSRRYASAPCANHGRAVQCPRDGLPQMSAQPKPITNDGVRSIPHK